MPLSALRHAPVDHRARRPPSPTCSPPSREGRAPRAWRTRASAAASPPPRPEHARRTRQWQEEVRLQAARRADLPPLRRRPGGHDGRQPALYAPAGGLRPPLRLVRHGRGAVPGDGKGAGGRAALAGRAGSTAGAWPRRRADAAPRSPPGSGRTRSARWRKEGGAAPLPRKGLAAAGPGGRRPGGRSRRLNTARGTHPPHPRRTASRAAMGLRRRRSIAAQPSAGPITSTAKAPDQPRRFHEGGHQVDGRQGEREAEAGLHGEHRPREPRLGKLRDARGELRGVGHRRHAPDQAQRHGEQRMQPEQRAGEQAARAGGQPSPTPSAAPRPIRSASSPPATQPGTPATMTAKVASAAARAGPPRRPRRHRRRRPRGEARRHVGADPGHMA